MMHDAAQLAQITAGLTGVIRPPRRMRVSEAALADLYADETRRWDATEAPYMIRPMDETASRRHDVVCFVGPARTGKTFGLIQGRWVYTVACHPLDFAVMHSSQDLARDFSIRDLRRMHRYSPGLRAAMTDRASDANTYDRTYRSGIMAVVGWPSNTQLASRTIPVMLLTDYDRWPGDIGGEGSGFAQARKRTQTAGSLAMTVVESSPGSNVADDADDEKQHYRLGEPLNHAFPATSSGVRANICAIYNGGTREWWYVPCADCGEYYPQSPTLDRFYLGDESDPIAAAETAGTVCCWCGAIHAERTKPTENAAGVWLADGEVIDWQGKVSGRRRLAYPSFALGGGAAAYQTRASIVQKYVQALLDAKATGDENSLKFVVNGDIGAPHRSIRATAGRMAHPLQQRAEAVVKLTVPRSVRFLMAAVDVQHNRFVVQVVGFGPDRNRWLIDRYNIVRSDRRSTQGESLPIDPAAFDEDWDSALLPLIGKAYALADDTGRRMRIAGVVCDSGGMPGVTDKALDFYRRLNTDIRRRFRLVKGESKDTAPLIEQRFPDTRGRRDRGASRGDVPVLFINTNRIKDRLDGDLSRDIPGPGYCHFPDWLGEWFFRELTRERRDDKGKWSAVAKNEAWDLMVYAEAAAIMGIPFGIRSKGIDLRGFWSAPPPWARDWPDNNLVIRAAERFESPPRDRDREKARNDWLPASSGWLK